MKVLLDTHLLLWTAEGSAKLPRRARDLIAQAETELVFSAASLWEIAIKGQLGRANFQVDPHVLRRSLLDNDYQELAVSSSHAVATTALPPIHKDPFDRLLIAQAIAEGFRLLTADATLARYAGPVYLV